MTENELQELTRLLPLFIPLLIIQFGLMVVALWDLIKREQTRGPKWLWLVVILFVNLIGPIIYLVVGREDES